MEFRGRSQEAARHISATASITGLQDGERAYRFASASSRVLRRLPHDSFCIVARQHGGKLFAGQRRWRAANCGQSGRSSRGLSIRWNNSRYPVFIDAPTY
jgi:hypothetical protein